MANLGLSDVQVTETGQTLTGTAEADVIDISTESKSNQLQNTIITVNAGAGDDVINGSWHHNSINGEAGNDTIYAGKLWGLMPLTGVKAMTRLYLISTLFTT